MLYKYEVYIAPKVGTIVVALLHRQFCDACALQRGNSHAIVWRHSPHETKIMASDNVFRVGASFRTFDKMQNALRLFEQQTHSQFYMRDARTFLPGHGNAQGVCIILGDVVC